VFHHFCHRYKATTIIADFLSAKDERDRYLSPTIRQNTEPTGEEGNLAAATRSCPPLSEHVF